MACADILTHVSTFYFLDLFLPQPLISGNEASLFYESLSACSQITVIGFDLFMKQQSKN